MKMLLAPLLLITLLLTSLAAAAASADTSTPIYEQPRNPGVAGLLSFFVPGGGHFYCGHTRTGALYLAGTLGLVTAGIVALENGDDIDDLGLPFGLAAAALGLKVVDIGHAMHTAHEINLGLATGPRGQPALMLSGRF